MEKPVKPADESAQTPPEPSKFARVQCISDRGVWASVDGKAPRQLHLDEVVEVPRDEALKNMLRNRFVVEIGR